MSGVTRRGFLTGGLGLAGAAGAGTATAQNETDGNQTGDGDGGGGGTTHTVEMTDELIYQPESITVAPGDTVTWVNVGSVDHSVTAFEGDIPDPAEYFASGGFESEDAARSAYPEEGAIGGDESYSHTFPVEGVYPYFCIPHEGAGMVGEVRALPGGGADGEDGGSILPDAAFTLGVATIGAMLSVLGLAYFFIKYGGEYGEEE